MDFVLDDLQAASAAVPDIDGLRNIRTVLIQPSTSATPGSVSDLNVGGLRWTRLPANGAMGHGHHRPNRTEAAA